MGEKIMAMIQTPMIAEHPNTLLPLAFISVPPFLMWFNMILNRRLTQIERISQVFHQGNLCNLMNLRFCFLF
ncbi:MAG: hypothetical protein DRI57_27220 [Deltaproteobacteria bacterium]|nr:MAG: hypothetical protein DRI57_27220 [Deltaproteobacteria bacterium]